MPHVLFDEDYRDQRVPASSEPKLTKMLLLLHTERICILLSCLTRPTNRPVGDAKISEESNEFVMNRAAAEIS